MQERAAIRAAILWAGKKISEAQRLQASKIVVQIAKAGKA
jgi:hypothetical protein